MQIQTKKNTFQNNKSLMKKNYCSFNQNKKDQSKKDKNKIRAITIVKIIVGQSVNKKKLIIQMINKNIKANFTLNPPLQPTKPI